MPLEITPEDRERLLYEIRSRLRGAGYQHLDEIVIHRLENLQQAGEVTRGSVRYAVTYIREVRRHLEARSRPALAATVAELNETLRSRPGNPGLGWVMLELPPTEESRNADLMELLPSSDAVEGFSAAMDEMEFLLKEGRFPGNGLEEERGEQGPEMPA